MKVVLVGQPEIAAPQHVTVPSALMAQLNEPPEAIARTFPLGGAVRPSSARPQQDGAPLVLIAQVCAQPAATVS